MGLLQQAGLIANRFNGGANTGGDQGQREALPAPIQGWNTRDPINNMGPEFALQLDNMFPNHGRVSCRRGYRKHVDVDGVSDAFPSLHSFRAGSIKRLWGFAGGTMYDCTPQTDDPLITAPTEVITGLQGDRWNGVNFARSAVLCSGEEDPIRLDSTAAQVAHGLVAPSGLALDDLTFCTVFKNRIYFIERDSAEYHYLPVSSVGGDLSSVDLSLVHGEGGNLVTIGAFTVDAGDGPDDYACFFMDSGAVLVYQGTDPGSANDWAIVGTFAFGRVVDERSTVKYGGDLVAITEEGYLPVRPILEQGRELWDDEKWTRITSEATGDVENYGDVPGWQAILVPGANQLMFNIPELAGEVSHQHIRNTITGAWCRFTGMNALHWATFGRRIFFGEAGGIVCEGNTGFMDDEKQHRAGRPAGVLLPQNPRPQASQDDAPCD